MKNLQILRKNAGLTQRKLAEKTQIPKTNIGHYELGITQPSIENLIKLADFFNCSVDYLLGHQAKNVLYLDSYTPTKIKIIEELKDLTDDEAYQLLGYIARMKDIPLSEVLLRKKD